MPRPVYTTLDQVTTKLPYQFVVEALDDESSGTMNEETWQLVAEDAADQVDSRLGKRYAVPFDPAALEPVVRTAALMFCLETLYLRRGFGTAENNPYMTSAVAARAELDRIGNGDTPLTPAARKPLASVMVISEPARTSSRAGYLSS